MFPISYRDLELMLQDRGVAVDHTTLFRWIQAYAPELEKRIRPHLHRSNGSWRVDETSYEDGCVKLVLFSAGRHRPSPCVLASMGAEVELRAARGALANLVSGGTGSAPRSLIRVGGAPRRAAPLYISGAVRQPTSRPGRRSLGPTGPVSPSGSGPIRLSAFAGAPPARKHPLMLCRHLPSGRLQLHPLRHGAVLNVSPERDQELSRQGHDHDLARAAPRAAQALVEPA